MSPSQRTASITKIQTYLLRNQSTGDATTGAMAELLKLTEFLIKRSERQDRCIEILKSHIDQALPGSPPIQLP